MARRRSRMPRPKVRCEGCNKIGGWYNRQMGKTLCYRCWPIGLPSTKIESVMGVVGSAPVLMADGSIRKGEAVGAHTLRIKMNGHHRTILIRIETIETESGNLITRPVLDGGKLVFDGFSRDQKVGSPTLMES